MQVMTTLRNSRIWLHVAAADNGFARQESSEVDGDHEQADDYDTPIDEVTSPAPEHSNVDILSGRYVSSSFYS